MRQATQGRRRRRTATGVQLSEERIVEAAANLLRWRGPDALSARKLGAALGADPTAVYRYFGGMDDVVLAVADRLLGQAMADWAPAGDWRATLRALAEHVYAHFVAHPHVAQVAFCRVTRRPHEMAFIETVLTVLGDAGFTTAEAVQRYRALADTMLSFIGQDSAALTLPPGVLEADHAAWHLNYRALGPDTHPGIAAAQDLLAEHMTTSSFPAALDFLLAGFGEPGTAGNRART